MKWWLRLHAAYDAAIPERKWIWTKKKMPIPMDPADRLLLVIAHGKPVKRRALSTSWQTCIIKILEKEIIAPEDRFSLQRRPGSNYPLTMRSITIFLVSSMRRTKRSNSSSG